MRDTHEYVILCGAFEQVRDDYIRRSRSSADGNLRRRPLSVVCRNSPGCFWSLKRIDCQVGYESLQS